MLDLSALAKQHRLPLTPNGLAIIVAPGTYVVAWKNDLAITGDCQLIQALSRQDLGVVAYLRSGTGGTLVFELKRLPQILAVIRRWAEHEPLARTA